MENMTIPMKIFDDPRLKSIMISVNPRFANALKEKTNKKTLNFARTKRLRLIQDKSILFKHLEARDLKHNLFVLAKQMFLYK